MFPKIATTLPALVALLLASGCVIRTGGDVNDPPARRASSNDRWEKLGQGTANGRNDHDVVNVGRSEGTFRAIRFVVRNSSVRMSDVVIHFTDGTQYSPQTRAVFSEGVTSNTIDLPGGRRTIRSVNFRYSDSSGTGSGVVEVWGI
jgi:hypothetical protein